jgi:hypothetical protein
MKEKHTVSVNTTSSGTISGYLEIPTIVTHEGVKY